MLAKQILSWHGREPLMVAVIESAVREQLDSAEPNEVQSVLIQWTHVPGEAELWRARSKRERFELAQAFYRDLKEPVLAAIESAPGVSANDLPGSGQAIVTGPVAALRELLRPGSLLDREPDLRVLPNVTFHAIG